MLIPPSIFHLSRCALRNGNQHQLAGVHFRRLEDRLSEAAATDGKTLVTARWAEDSQSEYPTIASVDPSPVSSFSATIPTAACKEAAKLAPARHPKPILANVALDETSANGHVRLAGTDLDSTRSTSAETLGAYPAYWEVLPPREPALATLRLDAHLLLQVLETMVKVTGGSKKLLVDMEVRAPDKPVVFRATNQTIEVTGCAMPLVVPKD